MVAPKSNNSIQPQSPATIRLVSSNTVRCWALCRNKSRCKAKVTSREGEPIPIPYCNLHLKHGDYAIKIINHPFAGKCAVARYDLPPKYRLVFHGRRGRSMASDKEDRSICFYPPNPKTGSNYFPSTRTLRSDNYNGVINPKDTGDLMQYAAAPGPSERQNCRSTFRYWGKRNGCMVGLEFITLEVIPKNTLLLHHYGPGWWSARNFKPQDVGSDKYPAPKRKSQQAKKNS